MKTKFELNDYQRESLLKIILRNHPNKFFDKYIKDFDDLIKFKNGLNHCSYDMIFFRKILTLVLIKEENAKRYRRSDSIKLLKQIFNSKKPNVKVPDDIINNLFYIYQRNILKCSEDTGWSLSSLLKDLPLSEIQIKWLLDNDSNKFVLNRIIKHPIITTELYTWAKKNQAKYPERKCEIMGMMISYDQSYKTKNAVNMIWGIYFSRLSVKEKQALLLENLSEDSYNGFIEVCKKRDYSDLLEYVYNNY